MMVAFAATAVMLLLGWMLAGSALTAPSISSDLARPASVSPRTQATAANLLAQVSLP